MTAPLRFADALGADERLLTGSVACWRQAVLTAGPEVLGTPSLSLAGNGAAWGNARGPAERGSPSAAARSRAVRARAIVGSGNG